MCAFVEYLTLTGNTGDEMEGCPSMIRYLPDVKISVHCVTVMDRAGNSTRSKCQVVANNDHFHGKSYNKRAVYHAKGVTEMGGSKSRTGEKASTTYSRVIYDDRLSSEDEEVEKYALEKISVRNDNKSNRPADQSASGSQKKSAFLCVPDRKRLGTAELKAQRYRSHAASSNYSTQKKILTKQLQSIVDPDSVEHNDMKYSPNDNSDCPFFSRRHSLSENDLDRNAYFSKSTIQHDGTIALTSSLCASEHSTSYDNSAQNLNCIKPSALPVRRQESTCVPPTVKSNSIDRKRNQLDRSFTVQDTGEGVNDIFINRYHKASTSKDYHIDIFHGISTADLNSKHEHKISCPNDTGLKRSNSGCVVCTVSSKTAVPSSAGAGRGLHIVKSSKSPEKLSRSLARERVANEEKLPPKAIVKNDVLCVSSRSYSASPSPNTVEAVASNHGKSTGEKCVDESSSVPSSNGHWTATKIRQLLRLFRLVFSREPNKSCPTSDESASFRLRTQLFCELPADYAQYTQRTIELFIHFIAQLQGSMTCASI